MKILPLKNRTIIKVTGQDKFDFFQGLLTVDMNKLTPSDALWAGLLTPQGKTLFDLFMYESFDGETYYIDIHLNKAAALIEHLKQYKLRSDVAFEKLPNWSVTAIWDLDNNTNENEIPSLSSFANYFTVKDPRTRSMGLRRIAVQEIHDQFLNEFGNCLAEPEEYLNLRINNDLVDPSEDMNGMDFYWPEIDAEKFNGVDYNKGCYVGQEVTARLKHKTDLKKKVIPVNIMGFPHTPVEIATDLQEIGTLLVFDAETNKGLAYVRQDRWHYAVETLRSVTAGSCIIFKAS